MATLRFAGGASDRAIFTPISSTLNNLPAGAGSLAVLARTATTVGGFDLTGLVNTAHNDWYHTLATQLTGPKFIDDNGPALTAASSNLYPPTGTTADDFFIAAVTWTTGTTLERYHVSSKIGTAESWTHVNSTGNKPADRAGPGTALGEFRIGYALDGGFTGDIALAACWSGTQISDADVEALWISKQTSDWCALAPTTLVECTATTLVDIGSDPSTFSTIGVATLTGLVPTGWTFDGCPAVPPPDVHIAWTTA